MAENRLVSLPLAALTRLLTTLLQALHALEFAARHLDPERFDELLAAIGTPDAALRQAMADSDGEAGFPDDLVAMRGQIMQTGEAVLAGYDGLRVSATARDIRSAYRALRREAVALEALFPLTAVLPPVHAFFLEPDARAAIAPVVPATGQTGIMHAGNDTGMRGGFSLVVPETYRDDVACPLVVALHGGSGHGRPFLWNWVKTARTRGLIVACPTATGQTWALGGPDMDSPNLARIVAFVRGRWNIDASRLLLSGMSDGGTFTLLSGLQAGSPFSHLAPIASGFHPLLAEMADPVRVHGLPIYLVHGARDWMFPVELAQTGQRMLRHVGAAVTYREISDLAHVYPRDENSSIVDWLTAAPS